MDRVINCIRPRVIIFVCFYVGYNNTIQWEGGGDFEKRVEGAALIKWISNHILRHILDYPSPRQGSYGIPGCIIKV